MNLIQILERILLQLNYLDRQVNKIIPSLSLKTPKFEIKGIHPVDKSMISNLSVYDKSQIEYNSWLFFIDFNIQSTKT